MAAILGKRFLASHVKKNSSSSSLSYAFSGSGWLLPYHLGVISGLKKENLINSKSIVSGSSGGSIAAVVVSTNINELDTLDAIKKSVHDAKPMKNIDINLRKMLAEMLPHDAYLSCSNYCHITMTKVSSLASRKPVIISQFTSNSDLIDCISASCFIPMYCGPKLHTIVRNEKYFDGGLYAFLPPIGEVTVSPIPQIEKYMINPRRSAIHPHLTHDFKIPLKAMLHWSLFPPSPEKLDSLYQFGIKSAQVWVAQEQKKKK